MEVQIHGVYKHFKGNKYKVLDVVYDCETNNDAVYKKIVIYQALYGENLKWARSYESFMSEVDHEKYPEVKQLYRFEECEEE